jgi:hypothetical protein
VGHAELDALQGLGGSVLESMLTNVTQPHLACSGDHDWQVHSCHCAVVRPGMSNLRELLAVVMAASFASRLSSGGAVGLAAGASPNHSLDSAPRGQAAVHSLTSLPAHCCYRWSG